MSANNQQNSNHSTSAPSTAANNSGAPAPKIHQNSQGGQKPHHYQGRNSFGKNNNHRSSPFNPNTYANGYDQPPPEFSVVVSI